jgi:hypothetical protein
MRCSKAHKLIGDYLEGRIASRENERLEEHLRVCADCRELLRDFQGIIEGAKKLPEVSPEGKTWPKILSRVREAGVESAARGKAEVKDRRSPLFPVRARLAWATALVLVVIGALVLGLRPWRSAAPLSLSAADRVTLAKLGEAEKHYQLAIRALNEALASQKGGLSPQVASVFERNLKVIDSAIRACQDAVLKDPGSLEARVFLLGAYQDKVEFLDNLIDVKKNSPSALPAGKIL